jgi:tetratricopeptide (TPR) repeat protein
MAQYASNSIQFNTEINTTSMKKLFTLLSALLLILSMAEGPLLLQAQPLIHGQVLLQNSRIKTGTLQPVPGAGISADSGGSAISDQDGRYRLAFAGIRDMTHARVQVHKHGLVVVNERDLQAATIGAEAPLRIFMADSAVLAQEQALLYEVNLKVLTAEKDKLIAKLRSDSATSKATLAELKERFNQEFEHRWAAEEFMNAQLEEVKERLPERVAELARVNLDFASERYCRAYALMLAGKTDLVFGSLEGLDAEAIEVEQQMDALGADSLRYHTASDSIDLSARQLLDCYRLKAEAHNLRYEFRKAAGVWEKRLKLLLRMKRGNEDLEVADAYFELSQVNIDLGDLDAALKYLYQELSIERGNPNVPDSIWAETCDQFAVVLYYMDKNEDALEYEKLAISIKEVNFGLNHPDLAKSYNNLSLILVGLGKYDLALDAIQKSLEILNNVLDPGHPYIAYSLFSIASIYRGTGNYTLALSTAMKADSMIKLGLDPANPIHAKSLGLQASILYRMGDYQKAKDAINSAISWQELNYNYGHPDLLVSLDVLATILQYMKEYDEAVKVWERIIASKKNIYGMNSEHLVESYYSFGELLMCMGKYEQAFEVFDSAYSLDSLEIPYLYRLSLANAKANNFGNAKKKLQRFQHLQPKDSRVFRSYSVYFALRNRPNKSLTNLQKAIQLGFIDLNWIKTESAFDALRDHPRYIALIKSLEEKQK